MSYPAQAYLRPIRQWALSEGLPFFTWKEQRQAMCWYELFRSKWN